jgi:signal transduction histidine kinase
MLPLGQTLPDAQFASRHRLMGRILALHVLVLPLLALAYGNGVLHSLAEGAIVATFAIAVRLELGSRRVQAVMGALGLLTCSAVIVHITGGLIEAHFHFFVVVTALSLYEDWAVFGVSIAYVLLHHGLGAVLFEGSVYSHPDSTWLWAAVHSGFILALCAVNTIVWRSSEDVRAELAEAHDELARRAEDLERSNAELQEFAYVASHDLSEPLRMVTSYLKLLERRYGDALDDDARQFIDYSVDGAARMRRLIDDLLTYSRVERGALEPAAVDTRETVDETLRALAATVEDAGAEVRVAELPVVSGDPTQIGQLFQNLIANALKFRGEEAPVVEVVAEPDELGWRFTVSGNGIGIAPEHGERIFKMFQRLHTRDAYEGTGIGLTICRRIVERHGGRLWAEPNPGGGTRFVFTLDGAPH